MTDTARQRAEDEAEQRRIWESRCPALLAERDALVSRVLALTEALREMADDKTHSHYWVEKVARTALAAAGVEEPAAAEKETHG